MDEYEQFAIAVQAMREIEKETNGSDPLAGRMLFPALSDAMERLGKLPAMATLLGIAQDGLPLLLRMDLPASGPLLVMGDKGCGKTAFLQTLMQTTLRLHPVRQIGMVTITDFPDEWQRKNLPQPSLGLWPGYERSATEMLFYLSEWARKGGDDHAILLFFDGLDSILHYELQAQTAFAYLLKEGPRARIWPVVTINAARAAKLPQWIEYFYTRVYGRVSHPELADELTPVPGAPLAGLFPGAEFCLRQRSRWLRFWLPAHN